LISLNPVKRSLEDYFVQQLSDSGKRRDKPAGSRG